MLLTGTKMGVGEEIFRYVQFKLERSWTLATYSTNNID